MICGGLQKALDDANRTALRHYCAQCGHNAPDERCSDPVTPPKYQREYQTIHRCALAATSAIAAVVVTQYPAGIVFSTDDMQAIEAFITERLRAHFV